MPAFDAGHIGSNPVTPTEVNMREAEIDDILECIVRAWKQKPHLRLGQLVANSAYELKYIGAGDCDAYYVPDWKLVEEIERQCGA